MLYEDLPVSSPSPQKVPATQQQQQQQQLMALRMLQLRRAEAAAAAAKKRGRSADVAPPSSTSAAAISMVPVEVGAALEIFGAEMRDLYDPARPNSYEAVAAERKQQKSGEISVHHQQLPPSTTASVGGCQQHSSAEREDKGEEDEDIDGVPWEDPSAAASLLVDDDIDGVPWDGPQPPKQKKPQRKKRPKKCGRDSGGVGAEIMRKMGWSSGRGLGAHEQGALKPLDLSQAQQESASGSHVHSSVVMICDAPESFDVASECSRFGRVEEIVDQRRQELAMNRVFVRFGEESAAEAAVIGLPSSCTSQLRALFYDQDAFSARDFSQ